MGEAGSPVETDRGDWCRGLAVSVELEMGGQPVSEHVMLLGAFLGDQGFQRAPKEPLVALGSGAMAALRVAAGRVGGVAAVARGGLVDAVGAVVGTHSLAQPAVAGTERLFREPAGLFLYLPGGGERWRARARGSISCCSWCWWRCSLPRRFRCAAAGKTA